MNSKDVGEDAGFFLYMVPVVASIVYGAYEWYLIDRGSSLMPTNAYLIVSKDPYLFLLSLVAVCVAIIFEVRGAALTARSEVISSNIARLQVLAIVVLVISYAAGLSVAGYDLAGGLANFLTGRYALIYAFFLLGISILLSLRQFLGRIGLEFIAEFIGLILIAISPVVLYGGLKLNLSFTESGIAAIVILAVGLILFLSRGRAFTKKAKEKQVVPKAA